MATLKTISLPVGALSGTLKVTSEVPMRLGETRVVAGPAPALLIPTITVPCATASLPGTGSEPVPMAGPPTQ